MEVSNEIKEDIRRTQSELKNAIRVHQVWVARLQEDESNIMYKCKVMEAEKEIIAVSQLQRPVVERLRRELESYQRRMKLHDERVDAERDRRHVARQLREHRLQHRRNGAPCPTSDGVQETFLGGKPEDASGVPPEEEWDASPLPSSLPHSPRAISQETFLRFLGLVTPAQKEALERQSIERRSRCAVIASGTGYLYDNFDMQPKRKKNQFPYLQTCTPPQTRSQRLRRTHHRASREHSPAAAADHADTWDGSESGEGAATPWLTDLPAELAEEAAADQGACAGCGRSDLVSLMVWCAACGVHQHTRCGSAGRCTSCRAALPEHAHSDNHEYREKLAKRALLRERNAVLCAELQRLEARAASLQGSLDERSDERRELLAAQIETQRNLQRLLDVMSQFKATAGAGDARSPPRSAADSGSDRNDDA